MNTSKVRDGNMTRPLSLRSHVALAPTRQRGAATLVVVMVLFFIIAMVAAYTSRNLVFEQRTSANQYRSTQALEAADAGIEWALAMLNGGRVDELCGPTPNDLTNSTFRARYIDSIDTGSAHTLRTRAGGAPLMPVCVFDASVEPNSWKCQCSSNGAASLPVVLGSAPKPMFRIKFELSTRADTLAIVSAGCTRPDASCIADVPSAPGGDALAIVTALVTLKSGLATPPLAPINARGTITVGAAPLRAVSSTSVAVISGGGVVPPGAVESAGPAGTPGAGPTQMQLVPALLAPVAAGDPWFALPLRDRMFASVFGMLPQQPAGIVRFPIYSDQPGVVRIDCTAGCNSNAINTVAQRNPGRVLWLDGNLVVNGDIGSPLPVSATLLASEVAPAGPVMLIVSGNATLTSGRVFGAIYGTAATLDLGVVGGATIQGALIAGNDLSGSGTVIYDADILNRLRTRHGTYVRVPGGWKDF